MCVKLHCDVDVATVALTFKQPYRLRYAASVTAASCLSSCGATMNQNDARDLCKQLRSCLADKSGIIQKGAAEVGSIAQ